MSNPDFLVDDYGVPKPRAAELMQWAREQAVEVPEDCRWPENERAYRKAELLIKRVKALGYRHIKDRAA